MLKPIDQLWEAVRRQDIDTVHDLIEVKKIDPNEQPSEGKNRVLSIALALNAIDMMALLLQLGADPNLSAKEGDTSTPLHLAATYLHTECMRLLLVYGANPNQKNSMYLDWTPLHFLFNSIQIHDHIVDAHYRCFKLLYLWEGDLTASDNEGKAPITYAARHMSPTPIRPFISPIDNYFTERGKYWRFYDTQDHVNLPAVKAWLRLSQGIKQFIVQSGCEESNLRCKSNFHLLPRELIQKISELLAPPPISRHSFFMAKHPEYNIVNERTEEQFSTLTLG
jgi:hypothetical protein